jgi:hypothetical protein
LIDKTCTICTFRGALAAGDTGAADTAGAGGRAEGYPVVVGEP